LCIFNFPFLEGRPELKDSEQNDIKHSPYKSALNFIVNANFFQKYLLSLIFYWSHFYVLKQDHTIHNCKPCGHITVLWNLLYTTKRMMKNILFLLISTDLSVF